MPSTIEIELNLESKSATLAASLMTIRSDIPVILCTGFSEQITEEKAKKMGIRKFIFKPMVMNKLAWAVREVLDQG